MILAYVSCVNSSNRHFVNRGKEYSLLMKTCSEFIITGIVGDWENVFTVTQNKIFDKLYETRMADSKLKFRFEI